MTFIVEAARLSHRQPSAQKVRAALNISEQPGQGDNSQRSSRVARMRYRVHTVATT